MAKKVGGKPIPKVEITQKYSPQEREDLLKTLENRFEGNMPRHEGLKWTTILEKLHAQPEKISSLYAMENTGGEPDVVGYDSKTDEYIFNDCSEQSPTRRSICYDGDAEALRIKKGIHPGGNAVDLAKEIGIEILDEKQYRELQKLGEFDTKTESWLRTPIEIRELGGAIFGNRRYNTVFVGHNSAPSFYSSRGFRGALKV